MPLKRVRAAVVLPVTADSFRSMIAGMLSMVILSDDTERREAVMIGTNEPTRTYPRRLVPVAVMPDERAVEVRVHFSTVRWCGGGADGGATC